MFEVSLEEALNIICKNITYKIQNIENVYLIHSNKRICAEKILSKFDVPAFNISAMDGYALPDDGSSENGYFVVNNKNDHYVYTNINAKKIATRVLTGQSVPSWAYCVAPDELCNIIYVEALSNNIESIVAIDVNDVRNEFLRNDFRENNELRKKIPVIYVKQTLRYLQNIRSKGEDIKIDQVLVEEGYRLNPCYIAQLASSGYYKLKVYRKPKVVLVSSGDELLRPPVPLTKLKNVDKENNDLWSLRFETNTFMLNALLQDLGARVEVVSHLPDDSKILEEYLKNLSKFDMIITTGGASYSEHDLIKPVLKNLGATFYFEKVRIKPAKPTAFALYKERPVLCLPGNPFATYVSFILFVMPALYRILNVKNLPDFGNYGLAKFDGDDVKTDNRSFILPLKVKIVNHFGNITVLASPVQYIGSGVVSIINNIDAFTIVAPNSILKSGDIIKLIWPPK